MDEDDGLKLGGEVIVIKQSQTTQGRARDKFKVHVRSFQTLHAIWEEAGHVLPKSFDECVADIYHHQSLGWNSSTGRAAVEESEALDILQGIEIGVAPLVLGVVFFVEYYERFDLFHMLNLSN